LLEKGLPACDNAGNQQITPAPCLTTAGGATMEGESTVGTTVRIPLHSRKHPPLFAVVDALDAPLLARFRWNVVWDHTTYYAVAIVQVGRRPFRTTTTLRMHRLIVGATKGTWVDHRDGNGLNNTRANLRVCSPAENARNRRKSETVTTPFKGVCFFPRTGRWKVTIRLDDQNVHLGYFATAEEGARAYDEAARRHWGEFASLNFPD
jgi:hypothetical protein